MDKKTAITALKQLKETLGTDTFATYINVSQGKQYLRNIFGVDSDIYKRMDTEYHHLYNAVQAGELRNQNVLILYQNKFSDVIATAIQTVEHFGIKKDNPAVITFITNYSGVFWSIVSFILIAIASISYLIGTISGKNDYYNIKTNYDNLQNIHQKFVDSVEKSRP